jgi:uncharacterized SAM-binding protein YcdF (DUF218 family)
MGASSGWERHMFFELSKLLSPLESPGDVLLLLLALGTILSWFAGARRIGLAITAAVALVFLLIAFSPIADWVTAPLENRFPRPAILPDHVDGLIVLGGAVNPVTSAERGLPTLNSDAERMTEFVRLAKLYPNARLVFSGGSARLDAHKNLKEADVARIFFYEQGLDVRRMIFERDSRNTYENVLYSKAIVKPRSGDKWILVQSAQDVPRSIGIFHKLGWSVAVIPVAYKTGAGDGLKIEFDFAKNLQSLDRSSHEWLGLLIYRWTGKTDELFPSPKSL